MLVELSKNRKKYDLKKLPRTLQKQFGLAKKIHWTTWKKFKQEAEEAKAAALEAAELKEYSIEDILAAKPSPFEYKESYVDQFLRIRNAVRKKEKD